MKKYALRLLSGFLLILLAATITACMKGIKDVSDPDDWQRGLSSGETSIVFGRIEWLELGEKKPIVKYPTPTGFFLEPILRRIVDRETKIGEVGQNGHFAWNLAPGTYVIEEIRCSPPWSSACSLIPNPLLGFSVNETGKLYYIGTLRADIGSERDFLGRLPDGVAHISVHDYLERDLAAIADKSGTGQLDVEKSLMFRMVARVRGSTGP
jgi:hypothetical protein